MNTDEFLLSVKARFESAFEGIREDVRDDQIPIIEAALTQYSNLISQAILYPTRAMAIRNDIAHLENTLVSEMAVTGYRVAREIRLAIAQTVQGALSMALSVV